MTGAAVVPLGRSNALVAAFLGTFVVAAWAYTMNAVGGSGRGELDAAIAKREKAAMAAK